MAHLETTNILLSAASDTVLAGLLITYVRLKPKRDPSGNHSLMVTLLAAYTVMAAVQTVVIMSSAAAGAVALIGLLARLGLMCGLIYCATLLSKTLASVRDESRLELNKKLELEFADRRKIEQELAHLASFAEQDPTAIIEMDGRGAIRYLNPAAEQAFGDLKEKGKNHPILEGLDAVLTHLKDEHRSVLARIIQHGDRIYRQQISLMETGPGLRLHMADVTELERLEQIRSDLLARLPGEMQEPLAAVQQSLQHLLQAMRPQMNSDQEDEFMAAFQVMAHLSRLAHEMIESSHADTGRIELRRQRVNVTALVNEVVSMMEAAAQDKKIAFMVRSEPAVIEALLDRDKIWAALLEIFQQATDRASNGIVEIVIAVKGGEVQCTITIPCSGAPGQPIPMLQLTASRSVIRAHGGRLITQGSPTGLQCSWKVPILSADDFFYERARSLHEQAVAKKEAFSLIRLYLPPGTVLRPSVEEDPTTVFWKQLQKVVSEALRNESDFAVLSRQNIWLALPGAQREDGAGIVERIQNGLRDTEGSALMRPIELGSQIASYPEHGQTVEALLLLIGWFTVNRPVAPAPPPSQPTRRAA